jgi:NAD(P)-dependent dehydrogenase (short-subunit alcohol dehydrogenase family)
MALGFSVVKRWFAPGASGPEIKRRPAGLARRAGTGRAAAGGTRVVFMTQLYSTGVRQTVVVTGGNQGLGFVCAEALALSGQIGCVIIAGHDRERIASAADTLRQRGAIQVEPMLLNLASRRSIHFFTENLAEEIRLGHLPPLQAVICNAGVQIPGALALTNDGFEQTFGVNCLGHFMLVNALLPQLAWRSRIVIVGGGTGHLWKPLNLGTVPAPPAARDLAWPERPGGLRLSGLARYRLSKQCNVLFAHELHRRLVSARPPGGPEVTVNLYYPSLTPGTQLARHWPGWARWLWRSQVLDTLGRACGAKIPTVAQSGRALARMVLDPALRGVSGRYFQGFTELQSKVIIADSDASQKWWAECAELVQGQSLGEARQPLGVASAVGAT